MLFLEEIRSRLRELKDITDSEELEYAAAKIVEEADLYDLPKVIEMEPELYECLPEYIKNNSRIISSHIEGNRESTEKFIDEHGFLPMIENYRLAQAYEKAFISDITYEVVGLRKEKAVEEVYAFNGRDFDKEERTVDRDVILCTRNGKKCELSVWSSQSVGYPDPYLSLVCGRIEINNVEEFGEMTHVPVRPISFQMENPDPNNTERIECEAFSYIFESNNGIRSGAKMEMFEKIERENEEKSPKKIDEELAILMAYKKELERQIEEGRKLYKEFLEFSESLSRVRREIDENWKKGEKNDI